RAEHCPPACAGPPAGGGPREAAPPAVVGARELEAEGTELLDGEDQAARRANLRDLLDRHEGEERAGAEPAVVLVEEEAEELVLTVELDDVPRELVALVDLGGPGRDPLARE